MSGLRSAIRSEVKADKVADGYVQLLMSHVDDKQLTLEQDKDVQVRLSESGSNSFQKALAKASALADRRAYKILRPALLQLSELTKARQS
jgi:hypothetical protein